MKLAQPLPKVTRGSIQLQWKRCGRKGCRCLAGYLHGPYTAHIWWEGDSQKKRYIRLRDLPGALLELEERQSAAIEVRALRLEFKEFRNALRD